MPARLLFVEATYWNQERILFLEKTELFAEIYGNTLIRQHTYQYVQDKANLFIEMLSDLEYADERMPCVDMSQLKVKLVTVYDKQCGKSY